MNSIEEACQFVSITQLLDDFQRDVETWSQAMKAVIEIAPRGSVFTAARKQLKVA
jgi:hypothetical protein